MARKSKERTRLLKLYQSTGDEEYRRAAECLNIPLVEWLEQQARKPGKRGKTVGKEVSPRLYRMARLISTGARVYAAARREVTEHGRGSHASKETAIDYLRSQYADNREEIEAQFVETEKMLAGQRRIHAEAEAAVRRARAFERQALDLHRQAQHFMPPALALTVQHHVLPRWMRDLGVITRGIGCQFAGWRNTEPKREEKRSNDNP